MKRETYPDQYLHVEECRSGQTWVVPISGETLLDIDALVDAWIASEFCGEMERDGEIMRHLSGHYFAQIKTDGREPESPICWQSGGFYLKSVEE